MSASSSKLKPPTVWSGKEVSIDGRAFRVTTVWKTVEGPRVDVTSTKDPNDRRSINVADLDPVRKVGRG